MNTINPSRKKNEKSKQILNNTIMVEITSGSEIPNVVDKTGVLPKDMLDLSLIGGYDRNNSSQGNQIEFKNNHYYYNDNYFKLRYAIWKLEQEANE